MPTILESEIRPSANKLRELWKSVRPEEMNQAEKFAKESGLPGSAEGPQDALRHILGSWLLYKNRPDALVDIGELLYEGITFDENSEARVQDFHNNRIGKALQKYGTIGQAYYAALKVIQRGRYTGGEGGRARASGSGQESELQAMWQSKSGWEGGALERRVSIAIEKHIRGEGPTGATAPLPAGNMTSDPPPKSNEDEKEKEKDQEKEPQPSSTGPDIPITKPGPDEPEEFLPTTFEELRQLLIEFGVPGEKVPKLLVDANLTEWDIRTLLQEFEGTTLGEAVLVGQLVSGTDTPDDFIAAVMELVRRLDTWTVDPAMHAPEITTWPETGPTLAIRRASIR